jgi:hypothetical protein
VRRAAFVLLALALSGCQTTAQESAKLERVAKREEREAARRAPRGLSISRRSTKIKLLSATVLHSSEGDAVVLELLNRSPTALRNVPLEISIEDAQGRSLYTNTTPGLSGALTSASLVPAHSRVGWIDDQIQARGVPVRVTATIGEGATLPGAIPKLSVQGLHLAEEGGNNPGLEGTVLNSSAVAQQELIVDALGRQGGRIVAAGRAVLAQAPAHGASHFQLFFIGQPRGAHLELSVHASTLG